MYGIDDIPVMVFLYLNLFSSFLLENLESMSKGQQHSFSAAESLDIFKVSEPQRFNLVWWET